MRNRVIITCVFILISFTRSMAQSGGQPRITQPIDAHKVVRLAGNTHPLAQAQFDRGAAPDDLPMERVLLVLQRGADQETELQNLLEDQQSKSSPQYHQWLTPEEFGQRFGPADADIAAVTDWLVSQGFRINKVSTGRTAIEFSGTAGQVRQAFRTEIHKYIVNGKEHWANARDPQVPAALALVVRGIVSLNNFRAKPLHRHLGTFRRSPAGKYTPDFTITFPGIGTFFGVGPSDFATIYNAEPLWNQGIDGTGQSIAIVARSDISLQDVRDYRSLFGLPANDPVIILDGPDPGFDAGGDETEADLDVQLSGGVAKGATIDVVISQSTEATDGVVLSALYIIDSNLAGIMSESFDNCEFFMGDANNAFQEGLYQQAAAQGITVVVSAGDTGSADCDAAFVDGWTVSGGLAVNGVASTAFNVAVGGTDFDDDSNPSLYWNSSNNPSTRASAKSYIPELVWNESCIANPLYGCSSAQSRTAGGGGGPSSCVSTVNGSGAPCLAGRPKPAWQGGQGVPADGVRDIPDVSFFAGGVAGSFYPICESDTNPGNAACNVNPVFPPYFLGVEGTSASAPAFAAVMAMVQQKMGGRQGNANYVLYPLAAKNPSTCNSSASPTSTCIFYDITKSNNSMPCVGGSPNCNVTSGTGLLVDSNNSPAWLATFGYDRASGLGSLNIANLVNQWNSASFTGTNTTLVSLSPTTLTHGQAVAVSITVAPNQGTGTPTGSVSLIGGPNNSQLGIDGFQLSGGMASGSTRLLPGGSYSLFARYAGDGIFGGSDSSSVPVTVNPETSKTFLSLLTFGLTGNLISTTGTTAAYGSPYILRTDVSNSSANPAQIPAPLCAPSPGGESPCPTGNVVITANGAPLDAGTFKLNSLGYAEDQPIQLAGGTYAIAAQYSGDNSFMASNASQAITIAQAPTSVDQVSAPTGVLTGSAFALATRVQTTSSGVGPTGTVTFFDNGDPLPGTVSLLSLAGSSSGFAFAQAVSGAVILSTLGNHAITATYSGDSNYLGSSTTVASVIVATAPNPGLLVIASGSTIPVGGSGTGSIAISPTNGFSGTISVVCTVPSSMRETTCSPAIQSLTISNAQVTATVTITTTAPHTVGELRRHSPWAGFAFVLGAAFLLGVSGSKRNLSCLVVLLMLSIALAIFGCGGGGGSAAVQDQGTLPGTYSLPITITNNTGSSIASTTVTVVVVAQ